MTDIELRDKLLNDPVHFNSVMLPEWFDLPMPRFHRDIYVPLADPKVKLLVVQMPRGFGKTTILQGFLLQQVVNLRHPVIVYVGDTYTQAELHTEAVREELEINDAITGIYGKQKGVKKWTSNMWTTKNGITVIPRGSNQSIRGLKVGRSRPSLVIIDDPENDENSETREQRDKLWRHFFAVIKPMLQSGHRTDTKIVYLGTPVHEDCVLFRFIELLQSSALRDDPGIRVVQTGAKDADGCTIWPELWSNERLDEEEAMYAEAGTLDTFYQEYYGQVIASKDADFPMDAVTYYTEDELPGDLRTTMSIDVAYSMTRSADFCAATVFSTSSKAKAVFIREGVRRRMKPNKFLELLTQFNATYRPSRVYIQNVVLDEFFQFYASEKDTRLPFEKVKISRRKDSKKRRIASLEPLYITGRLRFLKRHSDLLAELWSHPRSKHDDISDALAVGISKVRIPGWYPKEALHAPEQGSFEAIMRSIRRRAGQHQYGLRYLPGLLGGGQNAAETGI